MRYLHTASTQQVAPRKKTLPYSITPIADLKAWKAEQVKLEAEWQAKAPERRLAAIGRLEGESWKNRSLTQDERAELDYVVSRSSKPALHKAPPQEEFSAPAPPKSMFRKIKDVCLNCIATVWRNAFDPQ